MTRYDLCADCGHYRRAHSKQRPYKCLICNCLGFFSTKKEFKIQIIDPGYKDSLGRVCDAKNAERQKPFKHYERIG